MQKSRLQEAEAAVAAIRETRAQAEAEYRRTLSDDLAEAERKASGVGAGPGQGRAAHADCRR